MRTDYGVICRTAVHYTHAHPAVTLHDSACLNRIERYLAAIAAAVAGETPPAPLKPPGLRWLEDLCAFSLWDAKNAPKGQDNG